MSHLRTLVTAIAILAMGTLPAGKMLARTLVFPVEAIEESRYLPAEEWESTYPGIDITGISLADEGYYVRYRHENLSYFFGPIESLDEAQQHLLVLENVRTELIAKRPNLSTSEVDVVKFSLDDAVWGRRGEGSGGTEGDGTGMGGQGGRQGRQCG